MDSNFLGYTKDEGTSRPLRLTDATFFAFKDVINDLSKKKRKVVSAEFALSYLVNMYKVNSENIDVNI